MPDKHATIIFEEMDPMRRIRWDTANTPQWIVEKAIVGERAEAYRAGVPDPRGRPNAGWKTEGFYGELAGALHAVGRTMVGESGAKSLEALKAAVVAARVRLTGLYEVHSDD